MCLESIFGGGGDDSQAKATRIQAEQQARALDLAEKQFERETPLVEQQVRRGEFGESFFPRLRDFIESPETTPGFIRALNTGLERLRSTFSTGGSPSSGPAAIAGGEFATGLADAELERRNRGLLNVAGFQGSPVPTQSAPFLGEAGRAGENLASLELFRGQQGSPFGQIGGNVIGAATPFLLSKFLAPTAAAAVPAAASTAAAALPGIISLCWVAAAVYGYDTAQFHLARYWIAAGWQGRIAEKVRWLYLRYGKRIARLAETRPWLKAILKIPLDLAVRKAEDDIKRRWRA